MHHASVPRQLDAVVHDRTRLAMMTTLAERSPRTFSDLKALLGMTDGNLSMHARRLEEVGYVETRKVGERRAARTEYGLTPAGRRALERYFAQMQALIDATKVHLPPR
jgi:DNA-binding MarR family transcriptional regulator